MSSIFVVAATVVAMFNGVQVHPFPDGDVRYAVGHQLPTLEQCEVYRNSDAFKLARQQLVAMVVGQYDENHVPQVTITDTCHEFVRGVNGKMLDKTAHPDAVEDDGSF
jgi:hypothetical protein